MGFLCHWDEHAIEWLNRSGRHGRVTALTPTEQVFCNRYHLVRLEAELSLEFFEWCRYAKRFHFDKAARPPDVSLPCEGRCPLHRDTQLAKMPNIVERDRRLPESFVIGGHRLCSGEMES